MDLVEFQKVVRFGVEGIVMRYFQAKSFLILKLEFPTLQLENARALPNSRGQVQCCVPRTRK